MKIIFEINCPPQKTSTEILKINNGSRKKRYQQGRYLETNVICKTTSTKLKKTISQNSPQIQLCKNIGQRNQAITPETHHCNVIVALNNLPNLPHFVLNIARPDLTDYLTGICKCGWHVGRSGEKSPTKALVTEAAGGSTPKKGKKKKEKKTQLWGKMKRKLVSEEKAN